MITLAVLTFSLFNSGKRTVFLFINDFRFYDKVLSAEEIRTIMYNDTNLLLWYKFEEDFNDTTNKTEITTNTAVLSASPEQQFNQSLDLIGELYTRIPLKKKMNTRIYLLLLILLL